MLSRSVFFWSVWRIEAYFDLHFVVLRHGTLSFFALSGIPQRSSSCRSRHESLTTEGSGELLVVASF